MTGAEWHDHRGATGRPVDVELSIRDFEGRPVPTGTVGEVYMRPTDPERRLFEYVGAPTPVPTEDGFRTIGDLGWVDEDGYLFIADRRKDMIISGGANVFPAEVETALSEHVDVVDQVVVGIPDDEWGQRVHAVLRLAPVETPPTAEDLRAWCKERLAAYKVPKTYEFVDRLPRTEAGKLNRKRIADERG
jgi:bile acid-coenzyme A ligase